MTYWAAVSDWGNSHHPDGVTHRQFLWWGKSPKMEHGRAIMLFHTRRECRAWIEEEYGYLRHRNDLKRKPFWWRMPHPVRVKLNVEEI